jgi:hypothetical protein
LAATSDFATGCGPVNGGAPRARLAIIGRLAESCYSSVKIRAAGLWASLLVAVH